MTVLVLKTIGIAMAMLAFVAQPSQAITLVYTLSGSGGSGSLGNMRTFSAGGVTLTVTGWGYTQGSATPGSGFEQGAVGQWGSGLGTCNADEGQGCGNPAHQVDNNTQEDWVLFVFSTLVDPALVVIDPYGTFDRDVGYYTGVVNAATIVADLAGKTYAQLAGLGFGSLVTDTSTASEDPRGVSITNPVTGVNAVLFGPRPLSSESLDTSDSTKDDRFKISTLKAKTLEQVQAPEPGTLILVGSALAGLAARQRAARRRRISG